MTIAEDVLPPKLTSETNAFDLLGLVMQVIVDEPKRFKYYSDWLLGPEVTLRYFPQARPACGTIGCVAGWVVQLVDGGRLPNTRGIGARASEILGVPNQDAVETLYCSYAMDDALNGLDYGTQAYAEAAAKQIDIWRHERKEQLLAVKVVPS